MFYQNLNLLKWGLWDMYMDDDSDERSKVKWFYLVSRKKWQKTFASWNKEQETNLLIRFVSEIHYRNYLTFLSYLLK